MRVYHNPSCSKSCSVEEILTDNGTKFQTRLYLDHPLDSGEIRELLELLNISADELVRKGEPTFIENYNGFDGTEEEWISLMVKHPVLIQRPIIVHNGKAIIGRPPEKVLELI